MPYAISGKYHILKNNLTVEFGTPFKVEENDNLEEMFLSMIDEDNANRKQRLKL